MAHTFLPGYGDYKQLRVYQVTEAIYDLTYHFAHRYLASSDRTMDQMIQAARSGKQNIVEGNLASSTSSETEIKLTNVARASLGELLLDYQDYIRVRALPLWDDAHPRYEGVRRYARSDAFITEHNELFAKMNDEELCNLAITLIHQADCMLARLMLHQQERFAKEGGIRERMSNVRRAARRENS